MTRDVLGAGVRLARAQGAMALIVVPHFGVEEEAERTLRRRILDETGLAIATAIATRLRPLTRASGSDARP